MVSASKVPVNSAARRVAADLQCDLLVEGDVRSGVAMSGWFMTARSSGSGGR